MCKLFFFFLLRFTPSKVEQPIQDFEIQEKEEKDEKHVRKLITYQL